MDINLDIQNILVIKRMYELRNVGLVAESLGKTSGAISKTLSKLKIQLNDPLFIQTKHGFEPTTFVENNISNFEQILSSIEAIKHQDFSPDSYNGDIKIYANTLFWERFGSKLYFALSKAAPHANYSFVRWGSNARNQLIDGEEAIAVHYFDETLPQSISQMEFGKGKVVFFVREDHPAMIHDVVTKSDAFGITLSGSVPDGCRSMDLPEKLTIDVSYVMSCRRSQKDAPLNQWLFQILKATLKNKQA